MISCRGIDFKTLTLDFQTFCLGNREKVDNLFSHFQWLWKLWLLTFHNSRDGLDYSRECFNGIWRRRNSLKVCEHEAYKETKDVFTIKLQFGSEYGDRCKETLLSYWFTKTYGLDYWDLSSHGKDEFQMSFLT